MVERNAVDRRSVAGRGVGAALFFCLLGVLSACQPGDPTSAGYPKLNSVPEVPRPSTPLKERRQIVQDLIEERDQSRGRTAAIRDRSGLSVDNLPVSLDDGASAEDIIPDAQEEAGSTFRLTPDSNKVDADSVYRSEAQFEDGGLDDFIRQLRRDTSPPDAASEPAADPAEEDETSFLLPENRGVAEALVREHPAMLLAAFAPVARQGPAAPRDLVIRPAASEDEPGFFCRWGGWLVAWSNMCVPEAGAQSEPVDDGSVAADVESESETSPDTGASERSARSADDAGQERTERRLSEQDAAEAIEDVGRSVMAPVADSLDKLRDFIRARRTGEGNRQAADPASDDVARLRPSSPSQTAEVIDQPPIPRGRPELRGDVTIVDGDEVFEFSRTPTPAFKPLYTDQALVILPPEGADEAGSSGAGIQEPPPLPLARPNDLLASRQSEDPVPARSDPGAAPEDPGAALEDEPLAFALPNDASLLRAPDPRPPTRSPAAGASTAGSGASDVAAPETMANLPTPAVEAIETPEETETPPLATLDKAAEKSFEEVEPVFIQFAPNIQGVPARENPRLADLLAKAKSSDQKIYIIGEARTNHLARRRAKDVGAVLVKLGATVEVLEYDHDVRSDADQVRLLLMPAGKDPQLGTTTTAPTVIEK